MGKLELSKARDNFWSLTVICLKYESVTCVSLLIFLNMLYRIFTRETFRPYSRTLFVLVFSFMCLELILQFFVVSSIRIINLRLFQFFIIIRLFLEASISSFIFCHHGYCFVSAGCGCYYFQVYLPYQGQM